MSYFLHLCDWSVPYCASLEAWNWIVPGQHLNASHPRSSIWPNHLFFFIFLFHFYFFLIFSGNYFLTTLNCHITSTDRAFDLIPKLRARPEYQLTYGNKYKNLKHCDSHRYYPDIDTTQIILNNPQSNAIKSLNP